MTDNMAARTKFFDEFFCDADDGRRPAGGDPGVGARLARIPAGVAGGHDGLRDRPARGHRVQDQDACRTRRRADRRPPHRGDRSALRLAVGTEGRRASTRASRPRGAPRACSATCRRRPRTGCSTPSPSSARPGSRVAVESVPEHRPGRSREGDRADAGRPRSGGATTASTWTSPNSSTSGDRNEAAAYLADHGWQISSQSVNELLADNGLPPSPKTTRTSRDFGELQYVSGILKS